MIYNSGASTRRVVGKGVWHSGTHVEVDFHPPEPVAGGPYSGYEGSPVNFTPSAHDYNSSDTFTYDWDWNNDGTYDTLNNPAPSHTFLDEGVFKVGLRVTDSVGGVGTTIINVPISDVVPTGVSAGGPYSGYTGQPVTLTASGTCADGVACTFAWDYSNAGLYTDATGQIVSHTWNAIGNYTIGLQVSDDDGNKVTATTNVNIVAGTVTSPLVSGWNLVSFNLHPTSTAITDVLSSVAGKYDLVYAGMPPPAPGRNTTPTRLLMPTPFRRSMKPEGFWIQMNVAATLGVSGIPQPTSNISLQTGWNLVGYPSSGTQVLPDAFSTHGVGSDFSLVYAYHASDSSPWKKFDRTAPSYSDTLTSMASGYGYWVEISVVHSWSVPY